MKIRKLGWVGTRTDAAPETVRFFRDILHLEMEKHDQDFWVARLPDGGAVEVFGPTSSHNPHFTTGPVVGFVVDNVDDGVAELRAAGVEMFGPFRGDDGGAWVHFRAPDGRLYELTQLP